MTDFSHDLSSEFCHLIMPDGWHASFGTAEGVVIREGLATCAFAREMG